MLHEAIPRAGARAFGLNVVLVGIALSAPYLSGVVVAGRSPQLELLLPVAAALLCLSARPQLLREVVLGGFELALCGLIGLLIASTLWSIDPAVSARISVGLAICLMVYISTRVALRAVPPEAVASLMVQVSVAFAVFGIAVLAAAWLLGPASFEWAFTPDRGLLRFAGSTPGPAFWSLIAVPGLLVALGTGRWKAAAVIAIPLLATGSRAGVLAAAIGVLAAWLSHLRSSVPRLVAVAGVGALAVAGVAMLLFVRAPETFAQAGSGQLVQSRVGSVATNLRWRIWMDALGRIAAEPMTGLGVGVYPTINPLRADVQGSPGVHDRLFSHNILLDVGLDAGLGAVAIMLAAAVALLASAARARSRPWVLGVALATVVQLNFASLLTSGALMVVLAVIRDQSLRPPDIRREATVVATEGVP